MADNAGNVGALLANILLQPIDRGVHGCNIYRGVESAMVIDHQAMIVMAHADIMDVFDLPDQG